MAEQRDRARVLLREHDKVPSRAEGGHHVLHRAVHRDADQGQQEDGSCFGFVGVTGVDDYCGWFFSWPREEAGIRTVAEREAVLDSLEADEANQFEPQIPRRWARAKLETYLRANYDLRFRS